MDNLALTIAIVLLICSQILTPLLILSALRRYFDQKQAEIEFRMLKLAHDWTDPQPGDKPSKLAEVADALGAVVGSAAARSIMASLSADKSHAARAANGLTDEIQGAQNPILGILQGGKRGKGAAIARLGQMLMPMFSGKMGQGNHGDGSSGSSPKSFTL